MKGFLRRLKRQITWCTSRWQPTRRDGGIWIFVIYTQMQSSKAFSFVWILCGPLWISWCVALLLHATEDVCQNSRFDILVSRFTIWNCIAFINYISLNDLLLSFIQSKHFSYDGLIVQLFMFCSKKFLRLYFQDIELVLGTGTGCLDSGWLEDTSFVFFRYHVLVFFF